jgi:ATP-dependent DNA helicase RecG
MQSATAFPTPIIYHANGRGLADAGVSNERVTDRVTDGVTDGEKDVMNLLKENNKYTLNELAQILSVSRKTVAVRIKRLKEKGSIERIGSDRSGYWEIRN